MNYCRTCKYWSLNPNMIGAGNCINVDVWLRVVMPAGFSTAQNFGCVLHEEGACNAILVPKSKSDAILKEFVTAAHEASATH